MKKVYFKTATMGGGKTARACINAFNYEKEGQTPLCISPSVDTRFGEAEEDEHGLKIGMWKSRIEALSRKVFLVDKDESIIETVIKISSRYNLFPSVLMIDEAQFLSEEQVEELFRIAIYWNISVICYGLLTTYKTTLFEGSKRLIELGAKLEPIKSVGKDGGKAVINAKYVDDNLVIKGKDIDIGGDEKYRAITLKEFWDTLENQKERNFRNIIGKLKED